jgi:hypothetical protein
MRNKGRPLQYVFADSQSDPRQDGLRRALDRFPSRGHIVRGDTLDDLIATFDVHVGIPDDVVASLSADTILPRVTDIVFQVHSVDPPHPLILRSIELTAERVAPSLGWAGPAFAKTGSRAVRIGPVID